MIALDEYFLMVVFTLFLSRVLCLIWTEKHGSEGTGSSLFYISTVGAKKVRIKTTDQGQGYTANKIVTSRN